MQKARALMLLGLISLDADFETAENYTRQAIPIFEKLQDEPRLAGAYGTLGWYLYAQSKFEELRRLYLEKSLAYYIRSRINQESPHCTG